MFLNKFNSLCLFSLCLLSFNCSAHNLSFGTLNISGVAAEPAKFDLVFQVSGDKGKHLESRVEVMGECIALHNFVEQSDIIRLRIRQVLSCDEPGLAGKEISFLGLPKGTTILVRATQDGDLLEERLMKGEFSSWRIDSTSHSRGMNVLRYTGLGFEHILIGWDHLLFLCMLMLIVATGWPLIKVVTAFTIGHSITLILSALNLVSIPSPPTEALIALSIVFLAAEVIRHKQNGQLTITLRRPEVIAVLFGLIHGLGFASVLSEIGLPDNQVILSLVSFNIGVELGQLVFILVVLGVGWILRNYLTKIVLIKEQAAYVAGSIAAFWFVERIVGFI